LEILYKIYNIILPLALLIGVFSIGYVRTEKFKISKLNYFFLFAIHYATALLNWFLSLSLEDDAFDYFVKASTADSWSELFGLSVKFIPFTLYPLIHYLKFDFLILSLLFSTLSFVGFLYLSKIMASFKWWEQLTIFKIRVSTLILMLPGFHFWVGPIGKDSLVFFIQILILHELRKPVTNKRKIFFLVLAVGLVRPYLIAFLFGAYVLYVLLMKINTQRRLYIFLSTILLLIFSLLFVYFYLQIDIFGRFGEYMDFLSTYAKRKLDLGSYIVPNDHNVFEKIIYHLISPLFFDAENAFQMVLSFENLIFLLILLKLILVYSWNVVINRNHIRLIVLYIVFFLYIKGTLLYNIGLASRQKIMIFPLLFYLLFYFHEYRYERRLRK